MLKKLLILTLILQTPHILPSHSSRSHSNSQLSPYSTLGLSLGLQASGIICTWIAYKNFKKYWQAEKEIAHQASILKEMNVKVSKMQKWEYEGGGSFVLKEWYAMTKPSGLSQQQEKKVQEHWSILETNDKISNKTCSWSALATIGSLLLTPIGIVGFIDSIKCIRLNFNKN